MSRSKYVRAVLRCAFDALRLPCGASVCFSRARRTTRALCSLKYSGLAAGRTEFEKALEGCDSGAVKLEVYRAWASTISETAATRAGKGGATLDDYQREQALVAQAGLAFAPEDECALGRLLALDLERQPCLTPRAS